jgi:hypothetical protein
MMQKRFRLFSLTLMAGVLAASGLSVTAGDALAADRSKKLTQTEAASEIPAREQAAIEKVIRAQLAAFASDNAALAFSYASPKSQRQFRTPDRFISMVRSDYEPLYRPRMVRFVEARRAPDERDNVIQKVSVMAPNGLLVSAFFSMTRLENGEWRIAGCLLGESEERAL